MAKRDAMYATSSVQQTSVSSKRPVVPPTASIGPEQREDGQQT